MLSDGCLVFCSLLLAYWVRFFVFSGTTGFPFRSYVYLALGATVLCLVTYAIAGLYGSYRTVRFHKEAQRLFLATALDTLLLMATPALASVSSSVVRELMHYGKDVSAFLPQR